MSEKAAAAQKWAEAKEALDVALRVYQDAGETHDNAEKLEREAWAELEALAGRATKDTQPGELVATTGNAAITPQWRQAAGNLLLRPLG